MNNVVGNKGHLSNIFKSLVSGDSLNLEQAIGVDLDFEHHIFTLSEKAKEFALKDVEYARREELTPGRIATANTPHGVGTGKDLRKTKEKQDKDREFRHLLREVQHELQRTLDALYEKCKGLSDDLQALEIQLQDINKKLEALENYANYVAETGYLALGEDGYPEDQKVRDAIKAWEQKTEQRFDPYADNAYDTLVLIIEVYTNEQEHVISEIDQTKVSIENTIVQMDNISLIKEQLDNGQLTKDEILVTIERFKTPDISDNQEAQSALNNAIKLNMNF